MSRYFANTLPDLEEGEIDLNFGDALRAALDRITRDQDALSYEPSMYIGSVFCLSCLNTFSLDLNF